MAHIQRRCPRCRIGVPTGKACPRCRGTVFTWRVRYVDPDGRETSKSFKRKADADDFKTSVSHNLRAGSYIDPSEGRITVKDYLEDWRKRQAHHRPSTAESTERRFRTMVYQYRLGSVQIGRLRPSDVQSWQAALKPGYAPSTINGVRGQVAGAFNDAVRDRRLQRNPFLDVKPVEEPKRKVVPRTIKQVRAGQAAIKSDRYRRAVTVDAGTGLRWAELFGLTVDRIDFLRREITIDRQLKGRRGKEPIFGPPKTPASYRTIPVGDTVIAALSAHLAKYPAARHELVFRTSRGAPMTRTVWNRAWEPARTAMGLGPGDGLHQLRHFYASLLIAEGLNVKEVQERLGHDSAEETLNTYSHLFPGGEDRTRAAIDRAFNADGAAGQAGAATGE